MAWSIGRSVWDSWECYKITSTKRCRLPDVIEKLCLILRRCLFSTATSLHVQLLLLTLYNVRFNTNTPANSKLNAAMGDTYENTYYRTKHSHLTSAMKISHLLTFSDATNNSGNCRRMKRLRLLPSVLWHCWLDVRKSIRPLKNWVMRCWHGHLSAVKCKWFAHGPADATATTLSLVPVKSRMVYFSRAGLARLSWKKAVKRT